MVLVTQASWSLPCILAAIQLVQASSSTIKGVAPEKIALYQPDRQQNWKCLDGSKTIPFKAINDDYCDCPDGSDEPGTSACPNGYFYCENKGHLPGYIKSWAVNDGVCDEACCDGSDEYNGLIQCANRCKEMAQEYEKIQAEIRRLNNEGYAVKEKLIREAEMTVREWLEEKSKYEDALAAKRGELDRYEREVKALEKEGKQHTTTSEKQSHACKQHNSARQEILENRVKQLREEIDTLVSILHDLKRDHNHNYHDMAVKSAITGYDEFLPRYEQLRGNMEEDLDATIVVDDDGDDGDDDEENTFENEEYQQDAAEDTGKQVKTLTRKVLGKLDTLLPSSWKDRFFSFEQRDDGKTISELDKVRQVRDGLDVEVKGLENQLRDVNDKLNFDYGKEKEWLKLKDTCVEKDDGEYIYSLCILGGANQKSHKDGSNINLG
ncbi:glucosidase II beta subunit-like-domain-containing protein [Halteromyces radiatus]|uniref:glucosidase II beta subunit-like-domain-containing protein n=1 Tax=Halteromyces radiatus TaxID=101107 RepID=UPI002220D59E|nr:glucosidase II beta subunit-like-domain-containing protein [Halteromyces radiatus]KAI8096737.1 glucosidase II beta subunit-like-domain-containing protein [Halteromyces radiatus]